MKKLISFGLFLSLSFSVSVLVLADEVISVEDIFEDMSDEHENATAINFLYQLEVIEGYENEDGTREYRPDQEVNRAEFLKILMGGEFNEFEVPSEPCFPDVKETEWYAPYVCEAKEQGWIQGYPDGFFRPEQTINKVESLKVLSEVAEWEVEEVATGEEWYQPYLDITEELNLIVIEENDALMTRGDTAEVIFRQLQVSILSVEQYLTSQDEELFDYYGLSYDPADVEHLVVYGSIYHSGSTTVGESVTVTVELYDEEEDPVSGHSLEAIVTTPSSFKILDVEEESAGTYIVELASYKATTYGVFVRDTDTGEIYDTTVYFEAGEAESMDILNVVYPYENEDHTGTFDVVLRDEYGNTVEEDESVLDFSTTLGEVSTYFADGVWSATLSSDEVGQATVSIDGSFEDEVDLSFDSVMVGVPRGTPEEEWFRVPVYVNMGNEGSLAEYDISIAYNSGTFQFNGAEDGDSSDDFDEPTVNLAGNSIRLSEQTNTGAQTDQYVHVADLLFDGIIEGTGTIYAEEATLTTTNEIPVENMLLQQAGNPTVTSKGTKEICMDVFVLEGADDHDGTAVTEADVTSEVVTAELAYGVAAASCNCSHYIEFTINYRELSRVEWQVATGLTGTDSVTAIEDDVIEDPESDALAQAYGDEDCIPVFYVPVLELPDDLTGDKWVTGWTVSGGESRHIAIDQSRTIGNTLTHELLHMLSRGFVDDFNPNATPEKNADAVEQGASDPGNAMNYDSEGFEMSAKQCELIEWDDYPDR